MNRTNTSSEWNERYKDVEFAYGKEPNQFFKERLSRFNPGKILMPADGEGRNGVFAATLGWNVTSFDVSIEGRNKAMELAKEHGVTVEYTVGDFEELDFEKEKFDAIALIYAHFPAEKKSNFHKKLSEYLKPGGLIMLEAFSKSHLEFRKQDPRVGGPLDINVLYSKDEILRDFHNYEIILLEEEEVVLSEGKFHNGKSAVVRFVGRKIK